MTPGTGLIRKARLESELTIQQLADLAGVVKNTASKAELNPYPAVYTLDKYGKAMGLELVVFYRRPDGTTIE